MSSAQAARLYHERIDPHRPQSALSDLILGGQDGLVNVLGLILGVAAATSSQRVVLAAGLAGAFAETVSMAAVAFTSRRAAAALYEAEAARERRHIARVPQIERAEIRELYRQKGFDGELLDRIVEKITASPDVWVAVMMAEELRLPPVSTRLALRSALVVGLASLVGSLLPLVPFMLLAPRAAVPWAMAVGGFALFGAGVYKARTTVGRWWASGLELVAIGLAASVAGWAIGLCFR